MPTESPTVVRPVVPQDAAAAAARGVLALLATFLALPWWEHPVVALVLVSAGGAYLGAGLRSKPFKPARRWVDDLTDVPRAEAGVAPTATAAGTGLPLGAGGGLVLLLATVALQDPFDSRSILLVPCAIVLARSLDRLLTIRAVRRWEREQGVVLCRRRAPTRSGVALWHEHDVERMVAVPARTAVPSP